MVGIDQAGQGDMTREINNPIGAFRRHLLKRSNSFYDIVTDIIWRRPQFPAAPRPSLPGT